MANLAVVVDRLARQGKDNLEISLVAQDQQTLPQWHAGDHIDLYLPNQVIRQYSLTGSPRDQDEYCICVKKERQSRGGSRYLHEQLRIGQTLEISAPRSAFPLLDAEHYLLLAAGIGITPLLAMAEELEAQQKSFELFYYVKHSMDVAFTKRWLKGFQYGQCHVLCSAEGQSIRKGLPDVFDTVQAGTQIYLCGPEAFMLFCQDACLSKAWQAEQIHFEAFAPLKQKVVDEQQQGFIVRLNSTGQEFIIPPDKTIAQVLVEQQLSIPLSCEMGMCGACLTRVCQGEVDHQDTVQTESEKNASEQYIALCCSRAKSAVLEIDL
ncbi:PDR/VanB family oxidoreductase [Acinetobacter populi]|uniref:Oxidoreductase n=1 Tax=Acinetobacter populi TaxID=1582270 RepID=A0A1Z9Z0X7_9GAMM|nr:PDR/VanB family oxidoreductase [Acinetobacter populi]OUY08109.1 hypothetical protein CAP51_00345 [Acinetobacter populi]